MAVSSIAAFFTVSFLLVLVPGADWAYTITAGLRDRSVVPAVSGLMLGYVGLTAVVVAGVAALVAQTPGVLTALTTLGAGYLVWLGATTFAGAKDAGAPLADDAEAGGSGARSRVLKGAGVSGLNPKALLLYVALLPQFADQHGQWPLALQIGLLGLLHMCTAGAVYLGVGSLARGLLRARPAAARVITRLSGVVMVGLGALLLVEQIPH
ncbi:LysE family translocator [Streptomyces spirodelae]|uniref:LysE family translocator n=1 Tax=Streptomyces spirodelae TaxID=2812904 RepID=A0ABS3X279_9ACTN|nr:LysE family translocator [Streptomyces spirodelae]MBO8189429.1 LysE family translocator [Streptomyces spirodelae]